jgi:hypothetical protein
LVTASGTKIKFIQASQSWNLTRVFSKRGTLSLFTPESKSWPEERDKPGGGMLRDDLPAPESTKKVISSSLGPTAKFVKGSLEDPSK